MASSVFIWPGFLTYDGSAVTSTVPLLAPDGTAAAPSYSFANETGLDTGMYWPGQAQIAFSINGTQRYYMDGAQFAILHDSGVLALGAASDVSLSRGAANRLDLATGDSLRIVSGVLTGGGVLSPLNTVTTEATVGAVTYTAAQIVGGVILRDPAGAGRSDVTPTAALLLAALPGAQVGQAFEFTIRNTADAAETITVTAGTGTTISGTATIAQNNSKRFMVVFTNVTGAAEAYTLYSLGTTVH